MRLAPVLAWAAAATATPPRGFLLVATNLPVQLLQRDADADWRRDELGCVLRDICAQRKYPATVVVGDGKEADHVERNRPCDLIQARLLPDRQEVENLLLVAVTETVTDDDMDRLCAALSEAA